MTGQELSQLSYSQHSSFDFECNVCAIIKKETNQLPHNTKNLLKAATVDVMTNMNKIYLIQTCTYFQGYFKIILKTEGSFIE